MNPELSNFAARLHGLISDFQSPVYDRRFQELSVELFRLQFEHNAAYRKICVARNLSPETIRHWTQIPAVPTGAFKELELTGIPADERAAVFHSSGTTGQKPSRHFHCPESLAVYEASLWNWFERNALGSADGSSASSSEIRGRAVRASVAMIFLTPPPARAPHSSLVHMFEIVRQKLNAPASVFVGETDATGAWGLDIDSAVAALDVATASRRPSLILGTAFSFVHLLDYLTENGLQFALPSGSRVMETGGYKNRSRSMPKAELHDLITERLGVPREDIICEYGMSELSSQAYDVARDVCRMTRGGTPCNPSLVTRPFHFPPWARAQIISPETGREVAEGETGLIRIFDLANVFSVAAIQTEDLGIRRGDGFELAGRAQLAEPRGCSLMNA